MAAKADLVLVHPDDGDADPEIVDRCRSVETYRAPASGFDRRRDLVALARGRMLRAAAIDHAQVERVLSSLVEQHRIDVVLCDGIELADAVAGACRGCAVVVWVHEPAHGVYQPPASTRRDRLVAWADHRAEVLQEGRALAAADLVIALTEQDATVLRRHGETDTPVRTIPLGCEVPDAPCDPAGTDPDVVVFVGNYAHGPNVAAAVRTAERILPALVARRPDIQLRLVGANPPSSVRALAGANIDVTGRVSDIRPHLDDAAIVIAPLDEGGGTRVKVLEALSAGKALVASPLALAGIDTGTDQIAVVAADDDAFVEAISALLDDREARVRLGRAARRWAETARSWDAVADAHLEACAGVARR